MSEVQSLPLSQRSRPKATTKPTDILAGELNRAEILAAGNAKPAVQKQPAQTASDCMPKSEVFPDAGGITIRCVDKSSPPTKLDELLEDFERFCASPKPANRVWKFAYFSLRAQIMREMVS